MKKNYFKINVVVLLMMVSLNSIAQTIFTQWNFNGDSSITVPGGSDTPSPVIGSGIASLLGGVTATFASGNLSVGTTETVTTSPPNFGWNTTTYAAAGTENKQRGVQFAVSTLNYIGITFSFEQRLSNTANTTYIFQYTTDITLPSPIWVDAQTFTITPAATGTGDTWYNSRTIDLSTVTALNDNANVGFRIVSAFDPTTSDYLAARSTSVYGTVGTVRFDMVTIKANSQLGVADFNQIKSTFSLSPNPCNSGFVSLNDYYTIEVYDLLGKKIVAQQNTNSIATTGLNKGIYLVKTSTGLVQKMVIN